MRTRTQPTRAERELERAAKREHRQAAQARLRDLREKLRAARASKKERIALLRESIREQRRALRERLREHRKRTLLELRESAKRERDAARASYADQMRKFRQQASSLVGRARAELAAERERQRAERRTALEAKRRETLAAKRTKAEQTRDVSRAALGPLARYYDQVKDKLPTRAAESREETFLRHAEQHAAEALAAIEPQRERELERLERELHDARRSAEQPSAYEQRRAARLARLRKRADDAKARADANLLQARALSERIPFGQPILVGHHSQRRHERDIDRIQRGYQRSLAEQREAERLERRIARAESNRAISSDDPNAIEKLRAKLRPIERSLERMTAANAALRVRGGDPIARLVALGFDEDKAAALLKPDFAGRRGFAPYALKNARAEANRIKQRIEELEKRAAQPASSEVRIGDATIFEAENRVRVSFPDKPPDAVRQALKSRGFRWAPSVGAWQRQASNAAWEAAKQALR